MKRLDGWAVGFWALLSASVATLAVLPITFGGLPEFVGGGWLILLWELVPVAAAGLLWFSGRRWYAGFWLVPVSFLLIASNLEIFIWPSGSTAGLVGIFLPLWCLLIVGPISMLIARVLRSVIDRVRDRATS